jgi:hypothetical protein
MTDKRFREVFDQLERDIEERFRLPVVLSDVPDPFTGDLDGAQVVIDWEQSTEEALFILVHLFGHTVQWNVSAADRALGLRDIQPGERLSPELRAALVEYEMVAARYSVQLFHDAGIHDLDQWLADFAACDIAYLIHYYETGEKLPWRSLWRSGCPRLEPLPIPPFVPTKWVSRLGIVI